MGLKKTTKISSIFIKYLIYFCLSTIILVFIIAMFFSFLYIILYPANHQEKKLLNVEKHIQTSKKVNLDLIPDGCNYGVYKNDGTLISGTLEKKIANKAWGILKNKNKGQDLSNFYIKIPREHEIYIIQYSINTDYQSKLLMRFLPKPEYMVISMFSLGFIMQVIFLGILFKNNIRNSMSVLKLVIRKIQNEDLDFKVKSSGILEIDEILFSINDMKETLKKSLKENWELEVSRQDQISSLAHDIKTPLTIIKGNIDLLSETEISNYQKKYIQYIQDGILKIDNYTKKLIDVSKSKDGYILNKVSTNLTKFITKLTYNINGLTKIKKIDSKFLVSSLPKEINIDSHLLERAIMNVVSNAVEYTPTNMYIKLEFDKINNNVIFKITDCGKGFSEIALTKATQQFYMDNSNRPSNSHYGLGLYITKQIVIQHKGKLKIANSLKTGGGEVTISIPIST
ncbi:MAG: HAMP domain-containing sensor histidine kinase [Clostridiales bacterium]